MYYFSMITTLVSPAYCIVIALIFVSLLDSKLTNFHRPTVVFLSVFAWLDVKSGLMQARQRTA
jgi:hypothetical protein